MILDQALQEQLFEVSHLRASPSCAYGTDGIIVYANVAFDQLFAERYPDGTVGEDLTTLGDSTPEEAAKHRDANFAANRGDKDYVTSTSVQDASGNVRWFEWRSSQAFDEDDNVTLVVTTGSDITEQRLAEFQAQHFADRLAESNRDLLEFAQVASHDLQEPLRKVIAFGGRLETHLGDDLDDKARDYMQRMNGAAGRMQHLIDDLLTFARVTTRGTQMQVTSLSSIIEAVVGDLEISIEEADAVLEIDHMPQLPVDASQIGQLFQNLISNAIKFRQDGLAPFISIDAEHVFPKTLGGHEPPMGWYDITVSDNGIGFEEQYATKIFAPFQRLHGRSEYEGTGVGLSVCRRIVERHNGTIRAISIPGSGTSFIFRLPTAHFNEVPVGEAATPSDLGEEPESTSDQLAA